MLKITKIYPKFTGILTTMNKYENDVKIHGIIDSTKTKDTIKEYQTVVAVGPSVHDIKVGDMVMINPARYADVKHKTNPNSLRQSIQTDTTEITYKFNVVTMNDVDYLYLQDNDIMYVFEGEEVEDDEPSQIVVPESKIII